MGRLFLPELEELERILEAGTRFLDVRTACMVDQDDHRWPVHAIALGNPAPEAPAVAFFGGVHGLERIGTQVLLAFLGSLVARLHWDALLQRELEDVRLVFMPLVNPAGMARGTRANGSGVDLMRNAPVQSAERVPLLLGGQRLGPALPWYRGAAGAPMQAEANALCEVVRSELLPRPFSIALDCHSGFGLRDRIWFPHAHTRSPIAHAAEIHALASLFGHSYPHHDYTFEPQCRQYLTHGDLWDHLYLESVPGNTFLPLTLEMGSWRWVRKSPRQLFSRDGLFNPLQPHRLQRVLRRHLVWLDFLCRAARSNARWLPLGNARDDHQRRAQAAWYA